jgi:hypothetical protein
MAQSMGEVPEASIAGHFVGGDLSLAPTRESFRYLHQLVQDEEEWSLTSLFESLHNHILMEASNGDYYDIFLEFVKLPRSGWREVKRRIKLSIEDVQRDKPARPYRVAYPATECGFVFIPITSELAAHPNWPVMRRIALENFARAHKYEQRLRRCVAVLIAKDGDYFEIFWGLVAHPWQEDPKMERALRTNYPFRPVREQQVYGYRFVEG